MTFYLLKVISLLGGLALFLFGMDVMGKALERLAGGRLQTVLAKMSSNVFKGFFLGMAVTAIIQSSSATTVMVVGFVNSGIMTLRQAIGVIMGSNVGTTVTAWILSLTALEGDSFIVQLFKPSTLAPLLGTIGISFHMFSKSKVKQNVGSILLGFMALMTGMSLMSDAMEFLKTEAWFAKLMVSFSNPFLGILAGAVLTGIIQSSSASVGILQSLCSTGAVTFGTALPVILGQNIGTCVTAMISTVGANRNARRTGLVHLYFNLVGVAIFVIVFYGIGAIIPWEFLDNKAGAMDIALVHTGFNIAATLILLPANRLLEKLAYLTIPAEPVHQKPILLDELLLATPAVAIQRAHEIAGRMAKMADEALGLAMGLRKNFDPKVYEQILKLEDETDEYEDAIGNYLMKLTGTRLSTRDNRMLNVLLYTISDIERIADYAVQISRAAQEVHEKKVSFSEFAQQELDVIEAAVKDTMSLTASAFSTNNLETAALVEPQDQVIAALVKKIKSNHIRRLREGLCTVEYGITLEDLLNSYSRCAAHCSNVAVEMMQASEGRLESHEYLEALKSGSLEESARYTEHYNNYRSRFSIPEQK
ncbi:MAG: Na/Pi cotransporter family protein [Oscillospiraceae bacterium]|nr:Na/Pi cotransporter family protein [Oscillospiraceae bacterium]